MTALTLEESERRSHGPSAFLPILKDVRVLHYISIYFLIQMSIYGVVFYLPTEVAAVLGKSVGVTVGLVSAIPWIFALGATYWLPRMADRYNSHRLLAALTVAVAGLASAASAAKSPAIALFALSITASGFVAAQPIFWTFPTRYLAGAAAAGGIALVNAFGTLGGFVAPNLRAWAESESGSTRAGLYSLAGVALLGAALIALVRDPKPSSAAQSQQDY